MFQAFVVLTRIADEQKQQEYKILESGALANKRTGYVSRMDINHVVINEKYEFIL